MQRKRFLGALGGAAAIAACSHSPALVPSGSASLPLLRKTGVDPTDTVQTILHNYVRDWRAKDAPHVAVAAGIVSPNAPSTTLLFAGAPVESGDHKGSVGLGPRTHFMMGSVTKTFASSSFASKHGTDYKRRLDEFVKIGMPAHVAELTIEQIANYSSGFPHDDFGGVWWASMDASTLSGLFEGINGWPSTLPQCKPAKIYSYSNFAWGLLGLAAMGVKSLSDVPMNAWMKAIAAIGQRVGLQSTMPWSAAAQSSLIAGYASGTIVPESAAYGQPAWSTLFGAADLMTTPHDFNRWLKYNMGILGLDLPILAKLQSPQFDWTQIEPAAPPSPKAVACPPSSPQNTSTALGWFHAMVTVGSEQVPIVTKNGGVKGFTSWIGFMPWAGSGSPSPVGAFVLTNNAGQPSPATNVGRDVMVALLQNAGY